MISRTLFKFLLLSMSNVKRLVLVNIAFFPLLAVFLYCFIRVLPVVVHYIDSINISVLQVYSDYGRLAIVVADSQGIDGGHDVFVFEKRDLNRLRRYLFAEEFNSSSKQTLQKESIAYGMIKYPKQQITLQGKGGEPVITLRVETVKEKSIEILFYNSRNRVAERLLVLYVVGLIISFLLLAGSFCGINDYTQRVVFHETKSLSYLFRSVLRSFGRSMIITVFFSVIIGAIIANIYFYIFIMSTDVSVFIAAINFWMLVFFLLILLWVFPISAISRDESLWRVMKKSLFVSFDNFDFTLRALLLLIPMGIISFLTISLVPGVSGVFSFLNAALKELSSRYSAGENVSLT
jgi:hypothetical protein